MNDQYQNVDDMFNDVTIIITINKPKDSMLNYVANPNFLGRAYRYFFYFKCRPNLCELILTYFT